MPHMAGHRTAGPRIGDDTYSLSGHALHQLAGRRGVWLGDDLAAVTLITAPPVLAFSTTRVWR